MAETEGLTPQTVLEKAEKRYIAVLKSRLKNEDIFPLPLRGCSIDLSVPFTQRMELIHALSKKQKTEKAPGYSLIMDTRKSRTEGDQTFLKTIEFPTLEDYLSFLGKAKEFNRFGKSVKMIRADLPELEEWLRDNPKKILKYLNDWESLISVLLYFRDEEYSAVTLRNLPIQVPTKYIETRQAILRELLDRIMPEERIRWDEPDIALRYGLKKDDDFRFRLILPEALSREIPFRDLAVRPAELAEWNPPVTYVLVIENKHSFLDIDMPGNWLKIWGMGKGVIRLENCRWLEKNEFYYWGDLDPQGFEILGLLRTAFPHTRSVCMGMDDYRRYEKFAHPAGTFYVREDLPLTPEEKECYRYLLEHADSSRIEQERIDAAWVRGKLPTK